VKGISMRLWERKRRENLSGSKTKTTAERGGIYLKQKSLERGGEQTAKSTVLLRGLVVEEGFLDLARFLFGGNLGGTCPKIHAGLAEGRGGTRAKFVGDDSRDPGKKAA